MYLPQQILRKIFDWCKNVDENDKVMQLGKIYLKWVQGKAILHVTTNKIFST